MPCDDVFVDYRTLTKTCARRIFSNVSKKWILQ